MNIQKTFTCQNQGNPAIKITRFDTEPTYDYLTIDFGARRFMRTYTVVRQKGYFNWYFNSNSRVLQALRPLSNAGHSGNTL